MDPETILAGIVQITHDVAGVDPARVRPEASFVADLGVDSLCLAEIALTCLERFDVDVPDEEIFSVATVGQAVAVIAAHAPASTS